MATETGRSFRFVAGPDTPHGGFAYGPDGDDVSAAVRAVGIRLRAGQLPEAVVLLKVVAAEVDVPVDRITWHGLDRVPVEALLAELERRSEQLAAETPGGSDAG